MIAIVREVSGALSDCALTYLRREEINCERASIQHRDYQRCLQGLGAEVVSLPALCDLPDSTFVEDPVIVLDEVAILPVMGLETRRPEVEHIAPTIERYRKILRLSAPATLDGGDVIRIRRKIFVGLSRRTNSQAILQLESPPEPFGYLVKAVEVRGCLHLKTGCTHLGDSTLLLNPRYVNPNAFRGFRTISISDGEAMAANALALANKVVYPDCFPRTHEKIEKAGFAVVPVDISELQKAEAGLTCMSVIFEN